MNPVGITQTAVLSVSLQCLNSGTWIIFDTNEQCMNSPWRQQCSQLDIASAEKTVNQYTS